MSIKEDIEKVERKMKEVENAERKMKEVENDESVAMTFVKDYKAQNKRLFIIILLLIIALVGSNTYWIYEYTHTGIEEKNITETAETSDGGNACVGNNCSNGDINYGKGD